MNTPAGRHGCAPARWKWRCRAASRFVLATCLAAASQASLAADLAETALDTLLDLEVSGSSKFSLRVSDSPSSATIIDADQIRTMGYRTLGEALQSVRGLTVSSDRTYTYLGVRGFAAAGDYNTRILLLIDGNRVNDTVFDQAFLGTDFPLDLDLVERVEFIPGHGSAVHGGNALFGVINVVTRRPGREPSAQSTLTLGSGGLRQLRLSGSQPIGRTGRLMVSVATQRLSGQDVRFPGLGAPGEDDVSRRTDHERGEQLYLTYEQEGWTATLIHGDRTKGLSATPGTVFGDPRSLYRDAQSLADATYSHALDASNLWKVRLFAGRYDFHGDYVMDYPPLTLNRDTVVSRWWGVDSQLLSQTFDRHKLVAGVELQSSPRRDQSNRDIEPAALYLDDRRSASRQAVFVEDQWEWSPSLLVTAGLRWDRHSGEADTNQFSPRLAVVGRPADGVVLKYLYGTGFRPPNAYEARYEVAGMPGYKANAALRNEQVRGNEIVLELRPSPASRVTASAYANRADGLLVQRLDPMDNQLVFTNAGSLRMRGFELEVERLWTNGVRFRANYSIQKTHDLSGLDLGSLSPSRLGKASWTLPVASDTTLGGETVLIGRRGDLPGYGLTHLTLARQWPARLAMLSLSVRDVFDRQPNDPGSDSVLQPVTPQDGRAWRMRLDLRF